MNLHGTPAYIEYEGSGDSQEVAGGCAWVEEEAGSWSAEQSRWSSTGGPGCGRCGCGVSRNAPFCCLHSVIQSRLLPILQGIVRAQSKRHGKQMCETLLRSVGHCFGGDGAGEAHVRHYLLFWPRGSEESFGQFQGALFSLSRISLKGTGIGRPKRTVPAAIQSSQQHGGTCPGSRHHRYGQGGPAVQIKLNANKMKPPMAITSGGPPAVPLPAEGPHGDASDAGDARDAGDASDTGDASDVGDASDGAASGLNPLQWPGCR
ncbi:uncharacterized protein LOC129210862 [Grus americana]|uniref:uncharacterized protein LOC129210862 n=1 Tax=Grus americana TaxID=9117 RepID=UPI002407A823|nr:uncharacterized protein LOC129210862 [Grus americana]